VEETPLFAETCEPLVTNDDAGEGAAVSGDAAAIFRLENDVE
jgi:hypothetical protein